MPGGPGIRMDGAVTTGNVISRYYDSMLAKVIASAPTFKMATQKMQRALAEFQVRRGGRCGTGGREGGGRGRGRVLRARRVRTNEAAVLGLTRRRSKVNPVWATAARRSCVLDTVKWTAMPS